ncbi:hypothetical protein CALVIDRAFT_541892 [Calocera viscosa TUFC12733]|uniref:Uncharacterized protein n=1 Tax=Calocera viscosa (strain TUFC12733) TaxID=1330018 RepID=A0A167H8Z9_CALVF|nr:hypothetical protein CALVIDRAFT_541892 [Calocera viscosa TUFC12733]
MVRRASSSRRSSSSRSSASSPGGSPVGHRCRRSPKSPALSSPSPSRKPTLPQAPKWMQRAVSLSFRTSTSSERAEALAILHIALDWTRASSSKGWLRLQQVKLQGHVVRRLYRLLVLPREEGYSSDSECSLSDEVIGLQTMRCELPALIRWLPIPALADVVQLMEHFLPHLGEAREEAGEEYELDMDEWPAQLVRLVWGAVEPGVRERLRDEYAAILLGAEERYALRSRR